jgi:hypothetical protein
VALAETTERVSRSEGKGRIAVRERARGMMVEQGGGRRFAEGGVDLEEEAKGVPD